MPRQSRGPARSAPSRPAPTPQQRPAAPPNPQQSRPSSTAAHPGQTQQQHPPNAQQGQSQGSGLFGQMASTAAGVAVGSSIGHAIGGMFGGGGSSAEAAPPADQPLAQPDNGAYAVNQDYQGPQACANDINNFRSCMDQNQGSLNICGWYLEQLRACQQAASQY